MWAHHGLLLLSCHIQRVCMVFYEFNTLDLEACLCDQEAEFLWRQIALTIMFLLLDSPSFDFVMGCFIR